MPERPPRAAPLTAKLIKTRLRSLTPRAGAYICWDTEVRNFGVRVYPSGQMAYVISYRTLPARRGIKKTYVLGAVVLENSYVAKLASTQYLLVHSLSQEDRYDTDDASARELYTILVSASTVCTVQPPRRRQYCPSLVDGPA